jgi:hypothetical protein
VAFLYTNNEKTVKEVRKTISLKIMPKILNTNNINKGSERPIQ